MRKLLLFLLPFFFAGQVLAQSDLEEARSDLRDLKRRLSTLQREIEATETSHAKEKAALAATQREISRIARDLRKLADERKEAETGLKALEAEQRETERRIASRQKELAEWLRHNYMHGADSIVFLLSDEDPNQFARDAHYLAHLGQARLGLIDDLRADLKEQALRAKTISDQQNRLIALENKQRARRKTLDAAQAKRKQAIQALAVQLEGQQRQKEALLQDERHLGRVIETLSEVRQKSLPESHATGPSVGTARPAPSLESFAGMKGKLRFPVPGVLTTRFGSPWPEGGGATWKGIFIQAENGADVRAIASGIVVFSDWMRGYGNLLIIDHGNDYLSIYGNNDVLLKEVGDRVKGGDTITSVGASGIQSRSGLYFEIRHKGVPLDPQQWIR